MGNKRLRCRVNFEVEVDAPWAEAFLAEGGSLSSLESVTQAFRDRYGYTPDCILDAGKGNLKSPTYNLEVEVVDENGKILETRKTTESW